MRSDVIALVTDLVSDLAGELAEGSLERAVDAALARYSRDAGRRVRADVAGQGSAWLDLEELVAGGQWDAGVSRVVAIERPAGQTPPRLLVADDWRYTEEGGGPAVLLAEAAPGNETIRVHYVRAHVLSDAIDTVPAVHREALASWAAALLLEQRASIAAGGADPVIRTDATNQGHQGPSFASRAKTARARYYAELGLDPARQAAAGAVANWTPTDSRGQDRLTRPRRLR